MVRGSQSRSAATQYQQNVPSLDYTSVPARPRDLGPAVVYTARKVASGIWLDVAHERSRVVGAVWAISPRRRARFGWLVDLCERRVMVLPRPAAAAAYLATI